MDCVNSLASELVSLLFLFPVFTMKSGTKSSKFQLYMWHWHCEVNKLDIIILAIKSQIQLPLHAHIHCMYTQISSSVYLSPAQHIM